MLTAARARSAATRAIASASPTCELAAHPRSAAGAARPLRRRGRAREARPASTGSSCTTRTPTRWRPSSRRSTRARTATAARARTALRLPLEVFAAVRARVGQRLRRRLPLSRRGMHRGRQRRGRCRARSASPSRARGWISSRPRAAASSRTRSSRRSARPPTPTPGPSGYECMPQHLSDERGPFGRNVAATAADPRRRPRGGLRHAGGVHGRHPQFRDGGAHARARRVRHRRRGAPVARRSRLVPASCAWAAAPRSRLCIFTNYCEGLDQKHKQVTCKLWDREALDEPGLLLSRDGKRRLTAPRWDE